MPESPAGPEAPPSQVNPTVIAAMMACARGTPFGAIVEVGVFQGGTAWHLGQLAAETGRGLCLYDTFEGIPYSGPHDSHKVGDFSACSKEAIEDLIPWARVVKGVFPASAAADPPRHISFVHLDCDQEQSYREAIAYLLPRMKPGGVMWFDDAPCLPGAARAVLDVFPHPNETEGKWWVIVGEETQ